MINFETFYKISYGLFIVCSGDSDRSNGFISNTVFQVSSKPAKFAVCCNKDNLTREFIEEYSFFTVSVLHQDADMEIFGRFGYKSGREINKIEGMNVKYGLTGAPVIQNESIAYFECQVVQKIDAGTHMIFIGELIDAQILDEIKEPITYAYYRQIKKGIIPKNAPTYIEKPQFETEAEFTGSGKYKCTACGHIYDEIEEGVKFADLPDNWKCPICGTDKEDFIEI
jgi:flavin reductase (DIM6/NTAB) family NADH-FMN oxidoreductase RutF/rubredoxin